MVEGPSLPWEIQKSELWFSFMNHAIKFRYQKEVRALVCLIDSGCEAMEARKPGFAGFAAWK